MLLKFLLKKVKLSLMEPEKIIGSWGTYNIFDLSEFLLIKLISTSFIYMFSARLNLSIKLAKADLPEAVLPVKPRLTPFEYLLIKAF